MPGPAPGTVRTLNYDLSGAGAYADSIRQAVDIWNASVHNVRLAAGSPAAITIVADNGWPHAEPAGLGAGRVVIGSQAVGQGYDRTRIAAHELGHLLGLEDDYNGVCTDLMSGHSAGTSCHNAHPSPAEAARVDAAFAGGAGGGTPPPAAGP